MDRLEGKRKIFVERLVLRETAEDESNVRSRTRIRQSALGG